MRGLKNTFQPQERKLAIREKKGFAVCPPYPQKVVQPSLSSSCSWCDATHSHLLLLSALHVDKLTPYLSLPGEREELVGFIYKYISYLFTTNLRSAFSPKFFEGSWISFENTIPSTITLYRMSHYIASNWWPVRTNWVSWTAQTIFCTGGQGPVPAHDPTKF